MIILDIVSHVFSGEEVESKFQYVAKFNREYYKDVPLELCIELGVFFRSKIYYLQFGPDIIMPAEKFAFLDYHLSRYKGDPIDFYYFIGHEEHFNMYYDRSKSAGGSPDLVLPNLKNEKIVKEWVKMRKRDYYNNKNLLSKEDSRIKGNLSKEEISNYFLMNFYKKNDNGDLIMNEEDVIHLLHANFRDFNPIKEIKKFKTNANQAYILEKVYHFYQKNVTGTKGASRYCEFLKANFYEFDGYESVQTLAKNFSKYVSK